MKSIKRYLALILCMTLLAGIFTGCQTPENTAESESVPESTEETEIPVDYAALYADAASLLNESNALTVEAAVTDERSIGNDLVTESQTITLRSQDRQEKTPIIHRTDLVVYQNNVRAACEQLWSDGIVYAKVKQAKYYSHEEAQQFLERQLPVGLLDPSNYETVSGTDGEISFADALAAEDWAMPEDGELLEASGTATLQDGVLTAERYEIRFLYGVTELHYIYEVRYTPSVDEDLSALVPNNTKGYESLDSIEAAALLLRAKIAMDNAALTELQTSYIAAAAGFVGVLTQEFARCGSGEDYQSDLALSQVFYNLYDNDTSQYNYTEHFADGVLSEQSDDEEPYEHNYPLDKQIQDDNWRLDALTPDYDDIVDARVVDVGSYYVVEFTLTDDFAKSLREQANATIFGDVDELDGYSTSYVGKTAKGFLALEKNSYLPTALNMDYEGIYTISGEQANLTMSLMRSVTLYDPDTYEHVTGEALPAEEPETRATPLCYEVTGTEGEKLYLFGTIHVGDDRTGYLPEPIMDAFNGSDALAVEFDDEAFTESIQEDTNLLEQVTASYYYTDGTTIANHIDSDLYRAATYVLKTTGQYTTQSDYLKPYVWSSTIENFYLSQGRKLTSAKGADHRLMDWAREQEKEILNVESGEFQLEMLSGYSDAVQQMLLAQSVAASRNSYLQGVYSLYELWCSGDEAAIIERLSAMSEDERAELDEDELAVYDEYHEQMEVARNEQMLEVAKEYLQSGKTVFFAVGIAHLLGEAGLVDALREAGYEVTKIQ